MKTDEQLKTDLIEQLDAIEAIDGTDIEVLVDDGMVVLRGEVDTPQIKFQVERTARRIHGMRGLEIDIRPRSQTTRRHQHAWQN